MAEYNLPYSGDETAEYLAKARDFSGEPLGDGLYAGAKTYTAYDQYLNDTGALFKLNPSVALGYTINVPLYPDAKDDPNLIPYYNFESASTEAIDQFEQDGADAITEFESDAATAIRNAGGVPLGDGQWGVGKTYNAYNEYLVFNGVPYKPLSAPYTTQGADPTQSPDLENVQPYTDTTKEYVDQEVQSANDHTDLSISTTTASFVDVAEAVLNESTLNVGRKVIVDNGAKYAVTDSETPNGYDVIYLSPAKQLSLIPSAMMKLEWFGYIGTYDSAMVSAAAAYGTANDCGVSVPASFDATSESSLEVSNFSFTTEKNTIVKVGSTSNQVPRLVVNRDRSDEYLKHGMFKTPAGFDNAFGQLSYLAGDNSKLLANLTNLFPSGWDLDAKTAVSRGFVIACVAEYGNDANSGLDFDNAKRSMGAALSSAPDVVYFDGGHYDIEEPWQNNISKDVSYININPTSKAFFTSRRKATWSDNGNGTHSSTTLGGTPITCYDNRYRDSFGDFERLTKFPDNDTASVIVTPWSWCRTGSAASSVAIVNLNGNTPNNDDTWVNRSTPRNMDFNAGDFKVYCKGLHWAFGDNSGLTPSNGTVDSIAVFDECKFTNSYANDGLRVQGVGKVISINSEARKNAKDGFNYHQATNGNLDVIQVSAIEISCTGVNHYNTAGTSNGTTAHDECRVFRINGDYGFGIGPAVVDVHDSKSYNVNCTGSAGRGDPNASGFQFADSGAEAWMHSCGASNGSTADIVVGAGCTLHLSCSDYGSILSDGVLNMFRPGIV